MESVFNRVWRWRLSKPWTNYYNKTRIDVAYERVRNDCVAQRANTAGTFSAIADELGTTFLPGSPWGMMKGF